MHKFLNNPFYCFCEQDKLKQKLSLALLIFLKLNVLVNKTLKWYQANFEYIFASNLEIIENMLPFNKYSFTVDY